MSLVARQLAPGVQVVVDLDAIVDHLRTKLGRLDARQLRELGDWVYELDGEGDRRAEAIARVTGALMDVEGDDEAERASRAWAWTDGLVYALAVPFPR